MGGSLNQPSRVREECPMDCKPLLSGSKTGTCSGLRVPEEKASANSVPAAAVIRRMRALSGFIGFKGCVGGVSSQRLNVGAQPRPAVETDELERGEVCGMRGVAVKCIDITQNSDCEGSIPAPN